MSLYNLYTIGYSGFDIDNFLLALKKYSIGALVDVRTSPHSAYYTIYNRENIKNILNRENIFYLFLGKELGARPEDGALYTRHIADFKKISNSDSFIEACKRIRQGIEMFPICMMCAEKDPINCHRTVLVANAFRNRYPEVSIFHIHSDLKIESQDRIDRRIMALYNLEQEHLFKDYETRKIKAYSLREKDIAFNEG